MQNTAQSATSAPLIPPHKGHKGLLYIVILVAVLVVGLVTGVILGRFFLNSAPGMVGTGTASQAEVRDAINTVLEGVPVSTDLLKNPVVYEWRGSVEGVLIEKTDDTLVLSENAATINIPLMGSPGETFFYRTSPESGVGLQQISLDEIDVGTRLRGEFFVVSGLASDEIVGSSFTVVP